MLFRFNYFAQLRRVYKSTIKATTPSPFLAKKCHNTDGVFFFEYICSTSFIIKKIQHKQINSSDNGIVNEQKRVPKKN
jgi:hypothetical protein